MEKTESPRTTLTLVCWSRLYDGLVAGLAHDLAGRASALHSLALVGRRGEPNDGFVLDELEAETEKLTRLGEAVRALAGGAGTLSTEPGDVDLATLLAGVIEVLRLHHAFDGDELRVDVDPSAPPVRASAGELTRTILLLAADAASRGTGVIRVLSGVDASSSRVRIALRVEGSSGNGSDEVMLSDGDAAALMRVTQPWGCGLARSDQGWTVDLPVGGDSR